MSLNHRTETRPREAKNSRTSPVQKRQRRIYFGQRKEGSCPHYIVREKPKTGKCKAFKTFLNHRNMMRRFYYIKFFKRGLGANRSAHGRCWNYYLRFGKRIPKVDNPLLSRPRVCPVHGILKEMKAEKEKQCRSADVIPGAVMHRSILSSSRKNKKVEIPNPMPCRAPVQNEHRHKDHEARVMRPKESRVHFAELRSQSQMPSTEGIRTEKTEVYRPKAVAIEKISIAVPDRIEKRSERIISSPLTEKLMKTPSTFNSSRGTERSGHTSYKSSPRHGKKIQEHKRHAVRHTKPDQVRQTRKKERISVNYMAFKQRREQIKERRNKSEKIVEVHAAPAQKNPKPEKPAPPSAGISPEIFQNEKKKYHRRKIAADAPPPLR